MSAPKPGVPDTDGAGEDPGPAEESGDNEPTTAVTGEGVEVAFPDVGMVVVVVVVVVTAVGAGVGAIAMPLLLPAL